MDLKNYDKKTVDSFGDEWHNFDQSLLSDKESLEIFNRYFSIFSFKNITKDSEVFDVGCGTGRWARWIAPKVKTLNCVDPSSAITVAKKNLKEFSNVNFYNESIDSCTIKKNSQDFGYSLGVLHHIPNTKQALKSCVGFLKPGAPFLLYLYYSFDNRPLWFKILWKFQNIFRIVISKLPPGIKKLLCNIIAIVIYFPLSRFSQVLEKLNINIKDIPLSFYRNKSLYTMMTDSRDRFGTPLEKRFTKKEIKEMMENSDLRDVIFSTEEPFWCAIGYKMK